MEKLMFVADVEDLLARYIDRWWDVTVDAPGVVTMHIPKGRELGRKRIEEAIRAYGIITVDYRVRERGWLWLFLKRWPERWDHIKRAMSMTVEGFRWWGRV